LLIIFNSEELNIDERIILKRILKEYNGGMYWINLDEDDKCWCVFERAMKLWDKYSTEN